MFADDIVGIQERWARFFQLHYLTIQTNNKSKGEERRELVEGDKNFLHDSCIFHNSLSWFSNHVSAIIWIDFCILC